jgi:hypothetical protein
LKVWFLLAHVAKHLNGKAFFVDLQLSPSFGVGLAQRVMILAGMVF